LRGRFDEIAKTAQNVGGVSFISHRLDGVEGKQLREVADRLKESAAIGLVLLASVHDGRVSFVVSLRKELINKALHAGQLAREFAALIHGSGGGRPDFAEGGAKSGEGLNQALAQVGSIVKKRFLNE